MALVKYAAVTREGHADAGEGGGGTRARGERAGAPSPALGMEIAAGLGNLHRGHVFLICVLSKQTACKRGWLKPDPAMFLNFKLCIKYALN